MHKSLTVTEVNQLQSEYKILFDHEADDQLIPITRFLDEDYLYPFITGLSKDLNTNQLLVLGSQFLKRLASLYSGPLFYSLAVFGKKLSIDLNDIYYVSRTKKNKWTPHLYIAKHTVKEIGDRDLRNDALIEVIEQLSEWVEAVNNVSKAPTPLLWESVGVNVYKLYEAKIKKADLTLMAQKEAWNDFAYLLQLPAQAYQMRFNPLQRFYTKKIEVEGKPEPVRIRRTCCFKYETGNGYCKTCPNKDINKEACKRTKREVLLVEMLP